MDCVGKTVEGSQKNRGGGGGGGGREGKGRGGGVSIGGLSAVEKKLMIAKYGVEVDSDDDDLYPTTAIYNHGL